MKTEEPPDGIPGSLSSFCFDEDILALSANCEIGNKQNSTAVSSVLMQREGRRQSFGRKGCGAESSLRKAEGRAVASQDPTEPRTTVLYVPVPVLRSPTVFHSSRSENSHRISSSYRSCFPNAPHHYEYLVALEDVGLGMSELGALY